MLNMSFFVHVCMFFSPFILVSLSHLIENFLGVKKKEKKNLVN